MLVTPQEHGAAADADGELDLALPHDLVDDSEA
jgi:hypothetical protein